MTESALTCPSCRNPMRQEMFQKKLGGDLPIDICPACKLIWFDRHESLQLAAGGLLDLFKLIHAHHDDPVSPVPTRMGCPRCRDPLVLSHDMQRSTRFVYYRCASGHGRLSAFYQFLREKNFVRNLSTVEVNRLRVEIKQVRCSGCGAPISLDTETACSFCRAPIAVLDADAMKATLAELVADSQKRQRVTAGLASVDSMILALDRGESDRGNAARDSMHGVGGGRAPDLLDIGIGLVTNVFSR